MYAGRGGRTSTVHWFLCLGVVIIHVRRVENIIFALSCYVLNVICLRTNIT